MDRSKPARPFYLMTQIKIWGELERREVFEKMDSRTPNFALVGIYGLPGQPHQLCATHTQENDWNHGYTWNTAQ